MKDKCTFYKSHFEAIDQLKDKEQLALYKAIMYYQFKGIELELSGTAKILFDVFKPLIDINNARKAKYKAQTNCKQLSDEFQDNCEQNVSPKVKSYKLKDKKEKENIKEKEKSFSLLSPKQRKHKFGKYSHVLLTDEEKQKLEHDYGTGKAQKAIDYLDEYIEYKGCKANSHYLAIRKWVFKALEEHSRDKPGISQMPVYDDSNNPKFTDEDYETLLKELGHGG